MGVNMLDSLNVLNGKMTPKFDKYNNIYSVVVESNINSLVMDYTTIGDCIIDIQDNFGFKNGENIVLIKANCDEDKSIYKLIVFKKENEIKKEIVYEKKEEYVMPEYIVPSIIAGASLIIILLFIIIFKKRK